MVHIVRIILYINMVHIYTGISKTVTLDSYANSVIEILPQ